MAQETVPGANDEQDDTSLDPTASDDTMTPDADQGQPDPDGDDSAGDDEFFSSQEFQKFAQDPAGVYKAMQAAYTQKTQAIAADRKLFGSYRGLVDALQKDPEAAVRKLVELTGLKLAEAQAAPKEQADPFAVHKAKLTEFFGEGIGGELFGILDAMSKQHATGVVQPVQSVLEKIQQESAARESQAILESFKAKYPDVGQHEEAMMALSQRLTPKNGVYDFAYLEDLYRLATLQAQNAGNARSEVARAKNAARTAGTTTPPRPTPGAKTNITPPKADNMNDAFDRAFEAAKRGHRFNYKG